MLLQYSSFSEISHGDSQPSGISSRWPLVDEATCYGNAYTSWSLRRQIAETIDILWRILYWNKTTKIRIYTDSGQRVTIKSYIGEIMRKQKVIYVSRDTASSSMFETISILR